MTEHKIISLDRIARMRDGTGHSIFGASGSSMFLACSGSLIPNVMAPDEAGYDAAWGTVAHAVTEEWLLTGRRPTHLVGKLHFIDSGEWGHAITVEDDMLYYAEMCVDRCEWLPGDHLIEERVDYSHITPIPNQGGTLDFAAMQKGLTYVVDHKFGSSPENMVMAEENPQLMLYAIGLNRKYGPKYGFKEFVIRINQPRLDHFDEWVCSLSRLQEFEAYARERMAAAWQHDAPRTPGIKQCRFCKVRATCAANAKLQDDLISAAFIDETVSAEDMATYKARLEDDLEPYSLQVTPVAELSTAHLAKLLPYRSMAESWWKAVEIELSKRAAAGQDIPGHKVVEGRSHRKFKDSAEAKRTLLGAGLSSSDVETIKIVSPAQAVKLLRSKAKCKPKQIEELLSGLVYKPVGRATLVPLSDKRQAMVDVAALVFEDAENRETEEDI